MFFDVCILLVCVQHSAALLSEGTAEASDWLVPLCEWLLKATEREVSSENYTILPGYYLRSPGTAKESKAECIKILNWNHVTTVRAVRYTVCARKSSLTQLQFINRCTLCFKSTLFILEPPNQCSNYLQRDETESVAHFIPDFGEVGWYPLNCIGIDSATVTVIFANCK